MEVVADLSCKSTVAMYYSGWHFDDCNLQFITVYVVKWYDVNISTYVGYLSVTVTCTDNNTKEGHMMTSTVANNNKARAQY